MEAGGPSASGPPPPSADPPLFALRDLSHDYGGPPVLTAASLSVAAGEVVLLVGADGAGKSTLLRCAAGWTRPDAGEVAVEGRRLSRAQRRGRIALVPDVPDFWDDLTVGEHARLAAARPDPAGRPAAGALLRRLGLEAHEHAVPGACSRAHRQKLAVAMALLAAPRVLLLDEPLGPLDPESARTVWALLREAAAGGAAVLLCGGRLPEGAEPDRYAVLSGGRIASEGSPEQLRRRFGLGEASPERLLAAVRSEPPAGG